MGRTPFTQELKDLAKASEEMDAGGCWREVIFLHRGLGRHENALGRAAWMMRYGRRGEWRGELRDAAAETLREAKRAASVYDDVRLREAAACYARLAGCRYAEAELQGAGRKRSPALHSLRMMRRILVTGMSGTGKSTVLEKLRVVGFRTIDTDKGDWTVWSEAEDGYVWREERISDLLADDEGPSLYVAGTVSNQGRFYDRFDAVVLLSAPAEVVLSRIETRRNNPYGKTAAQRELVLRHLAEVEPLLRRTCTHEVDATQSLPEIVAQLTELGRDHSP